MWNHVKSSVNHLFCAHRSSKFIICGQSMMSECTARLVMFCCCFLPFCWVIHHLSDVQCSNVCQFNCHDVAIIYCCIKSWIKFNQLITTANHLKSQSKNHISEFNCKVKSWKIVKNDLNFNTILSSQIKVNKRILWQYSYSRNSKSKSEFMAINF